MTLHIVPQRPNALLHPEVYTGGPNEGPGLVSPTAFQRIADAMNYISCRQKKLVFWRAQNFRSLPLTLTAADTKVWPAYFRTGEATTKLVVFAGIVPTPYAAAAIPKLRIKVKRASDGVEVNAAGEGDIDHDSASAPSTVATASGVSHKRFVITGLAPDTEYYIENQIIQGLCLVYMVVYEATSRHADDSVAGVCGLGKFVAKGPIYDEHIQDLVDANNRLWKHNGAHLLSWCGDYEAAPAAAGVPVITGSTSYVDVYSRDFYLATLYHSTRRRSGASAVPVKMAVLSDRTGGGGGTLDVRLWDGTNSIAVTGIGDGSSATWSTATGTLPAQLANYRLQAKQSNTITTHYLLGVSLFEYEA